MQEMAEEVRYNDSIHVGILYIGIQFGSQVSGIRMNVKRTRSSSQNK